MRLKRAAGVDDMPGVEINGIPGNDAAGDGMSIVSREIQFWRKNGLAVDGGFFPPDDTFGQRQVRTGAADVAVTRKKAAIRWLISSAVGRSGQDRGHRPTPG